MHSLGYQWKIDGGVNQQGHYQTPEEHGNPENGKSPETQRTLGVAWNQGKALVLRRIQNTEVVLMSDLKLRTCSYDV
jgi:hypothetical protein